jgi:hypothetical protein
MARDATMEFYMIKRIRRVRKTQPYFHRKVILKASLNLSCLLLFVFPITRQRNTALPFKNSICLPEEGQTAWEDGRRVNWGFKVFKKFEEGRK